MKNSNVLIGLGIALLLVILAFVLRYPSPSERMIERAVSAENRNLIHDLKADIAAGREEIVSLEGRVERAENRADRYWSAKWGAEKALGKTQDTLVLTRDSLVQTRKRLVTVTGLLFLNEQQLDWYANAPFPWLPWRQNMLPGPYMPQHAWPMNSFPMSTYENISVPFGHEVEYEDKRVKIRITPSGEILRLAKEEKVAAN